MKSKYKNRRIYQGSEKFDSKREYERFLELKTAEKKGEITGLNRQAGFILIDKSQYGRAIKYVADFVYRDSGGTLHVEDVKSPYTAKNPVYRIKRRLMQEVYGITIEEVY